MKKTFFTILTISLTLISTNFALAQEPLNKLKGKILLQVESHGEAWYIEPNTGERYYLANGNEAYNIMRNLGIGITNKNLEKIKNNTNLALKQKGKIFLQVESKGEAYYVDFTGKLHYLKDGESAYTAMRTLGLGIKNIELNKIKISNKSNSATTSVENKKVVITEETKTNKPQDALFIQSKSLVNNSIEGLKQTINTSDNYIKLMDERKASLNSKISRANEVVDILSTMTSSGAPSLIKAINAINEEYKNEIANMEEYGNILLKSREVFSSQLTKMNALSKTLDDSQKISSYPYQKVIDTLNSNETLFLEASQGIEKNLKSFKSSSATNDIQYEAWRSKINSAIDTMSAIATAPTPTPSKTNFKCYVNSSYSGKVSSIDCY